MACRAAAPLPPPPPPPPVDPCEKVTDQRRCVADPACEWFSGPAICPACLGPGCECRPPAPGSGECRRKSKPDCASCPDCCDPLPPAPKCFVGGCSGEICSDKPGQVSICIFPPPGGMPPRGAVCDRQTDGTCGWSIPAVY